MNILFLCTGNSARSILAECLLNRLAAGRHQAFSAGSQPTGTVNPGAISLLEREGFETHTLRSKSWDEFAQVGAPKMDLIITVCASAAGETCPIWPGHPASGHWGLPDPASYTKSDDVETAFRRAYDILRNRIVAFLSSETDDLSDQEMRRLLSDVGALDANVTDLLAPGPD